MNVKELTDKELLDLYKKNSSEIINLFLILNAKDNILIVKELKNRGLFHTLPQLEKIKKELMQLNDNNNIILEEELKEEKEKTRKKELELKAKAEEKEEFKTTLKEYVLISYIVGSIDKGEYFKKRDYNLSNENIEELQNLYMTLINGINNHYKSKSITEVRVDNVLEYSTKFLDRNYKTKQEEREYEPSLDNKYY